jgi:N-alpha-acetyl-L-2,4-diaminobutyrate deacetylase
MENKAVMQSPVTPSIDLDGDGVQHGFLRLPYSRDDSAWGAIMIPITVVKNGSGPTALLIGGNHGDEYEGPIALCKLAASLHVHDVNGRVIIVPFLNYPAFRAATRTSPIDKGNLNRAFPGKPDGTVTQKIADYVQRQLLPLADYVLDIHSGGKTLDFLPFAAVHVLEDKQQQARCEAAMHAFGAPYSMTMLEIDSVGMLDTSVEQAGKVFVTTELGGGGSTSTKSVAIAERGVRNFLIYAGIVCGQVERCVDRRTLSMPDGDCFVTSEHDGLVEMCLDLGDEVRSGALIARVHDIRRTGVAPVEYRAKRAGILASRHFPGLVQCGDTLAVIAEVVSF